MGVDILEDNDMAALDGSRTGGNYSNDIAIRRKRVIAGTKQPVNVSAIIKNIAIKYSKKIETCEEADKVIGKIESQIDNTSELITQCKLKQPINNKRLLKLKAQFIALKEQLEFVKLEKERLKCLQEIKGNEDYANVTDVTMQENEIPTIPEDGSPAVIHAKIPDFKEFETKPIKLDPMMLGVGLLGVAILGYLLLINSQKSIA